MNWQGWAEIALILGLQVALALPLGIHLSRLWNGERTWPDPVLRPVERAFCRAMGVDAAAPQTWHGYAGAFLAFRAAGFIVLYAILRLQGLLPLNPRGFDALSAHLAFHAAVSFVTNTNWQSYGGETTMSHFSQMAGLTVQNFVSAAAGATMAATLARAFVAHRGEAVGNFWADLTRTTLYLLLPLSFTVALVLVALGVPQTLAAAARATALEGAGQVISLAPTASQLAIKQLGINGGGIFNANSAHPFENPTPLTNLITAVSINKLHPRELTGNPVILATEVVAVLATISAIAMGLEGHPIGFAAQIAAWLWATVLFADFAESVAEGRGKAAAGDIDTLLLDKTGTITFGTAWQPMSWLPRACGRRGRCGRR
jgi:K+-transporting ATPase ATPase A chain